MKNQKLFGIGLDFEVSKRPLFRLDETTYLNDDNSFTEATEHVETPWFATVNDATDESLGVVGNSYHVTQNAQIMNVLHEVAKDNNYTVSHSGPINGGRQCFAQLKLEDTMQVANDEIIKYVFATWGHDGKHGVRIGFGNQVVSCANQFYQFHNSASHKLRHDSTIEEQLRAIPEIMNSYKAEEEEMYHTFEEWSKVEIWTDKKLMDFRTNLWKDLSGIDRAMSHQEMVKEYSTRRVNAAMDLQQSINTEMGVHGQTLWGLFNGVTHFVNHKKSVPNRAFGRDESLMVGGGARMSNKAFKMIDAFAATI